jgi:CDP-diacylglycerol---serine O-phosphatidyltransferase
MNQPEKKDSSDLSRPFRGTGGIPNIFTLLNLICGCLSIVFTLQNNIIFINDMGGTSDIMPEQMWLGALFIFAAAVIDFLDGFLARALNASSEMGKQLDSLSDIVSFGVAPGVILYQLLRMSWAQDADGMNVSIIALIPAFIFSAAVAWRLAKFNISTTQTSSFIGVPSPAGGLLIASFPLIIWYQYFGVQEYLLNPWVLYAVILLVSYLMNSNRRFLAVKFKDFSFKNNSTTYILILLAVVCVVFLKWLSVPVIFLLYVIFSFFSKEPAVAIADINQKNIDLTV